MAKNNLAGLAALGALGMMMSKGKKTEVEDRFGSGAGTPYDMRDMRGGAEDERPAPTGMGEATQLLSDRGENFSNEGRSGYVQSPVKMPSKGGSTLSLPPRDNTISPSRGSLASTIRTGGVGIAANGGSRIHPEYDEDIAPARQRDKEENMRNYKPRRLPQANSTTEEGMRNYVSRAPSGMKKGGVVKMAKGGMTSSASRRADGIASKGKTRGKIC
jgi:hypothetical protein